jgi:hypothetical protein
MELPRFIETRNGYGDAEVAEVVAHVALNIFTNYFNNWPAPSSTSSGPRPFRPERRRATRPIHRFGPRANSLKHAANESGLKVAIAHPPMRKRALILEQSLVGLTRFGPPYRRRNKWLIARVDWTGVPTFHRLIAAAHIGVRSIPLLWAIYAPARPRRSRQSMKSWLSAGQGDTPGNRIHARTSDARILRGTGQPPEDHIGLQIRSPLRIWRVSLQSPPDQRSPSCGSWVSRRRSGDDPPRISKRPTTDTVLGLDEQLAGPWMAPQGLEHQQVARLDFGRRGACSLGIGDPSVSSTAGSTTVATPYFLAPRPTRR